MIFLNKNTNVKWEISDGEHIRRLLNDEDYEVIEKVKETEKLDLDILEYTELQTIAKEKGLKSVGIKKEDLIESLKEVE